MKGEGCVCVFFYVRSGHCGCFFQFNEKCSGDMKDACSGRIIQYEKFFMYLVDIQLQKCVSQLYAVHFIKHIHFFQILTFSFTFSSMFAVLRRLSNIICMRLYMLLNHNAIFSFVNAKSPQTVPHEKPNLIEKPKQAPPFH